MWTPKQLLYDETVDKLRHGGFSEMEIEFLGWLSKFAFALNNSKNPVKAAITIFAKESAQQMIEVYMKNKKDAVAPKTDDETAEAARKNRKALGKLEDWQNETIAETVPKKRAAGADD